MESILSKLQRPLIDATEDTNADSLFFKKSALDLIDIISSDKPSASPDSQHNEFFNVDHLDIIGVSKESFLNITQALESLKNSPQKTLSNPHNESDQFSNGDSTNLSEHNLDNSIDYDKFPLLAGLEIKEEPSLYLWEDFNENSLCTLQPKRHVISHQFIIEQTQAEFDHFTSQILSIDEDVPIIRPSYFIRCLKMLVCGKQTQLFLYNSKRQVFSKCDPGLYKIAGISCDVIADISEAAIDAGSKMVRLKDTCQVIYSRASDPKVGPILVAFANKITKLLFSLERYILSPGKELEGLSQKSEHILACYKYLSAPMRIIDLMAVLLGCDDLTKALVLNKLPPSWVLLNTLYDRCSRFEFLSKDEITSTESSEYGNLFNLSNLFRYMMYGTVSQWLSKLELFTGLGSKSNLLNIARFHSTDSSSLRYYPDEDIFLYIDMSRHREAVEALKKNDDSTLDEIRSISLFKVDEERVPVFMSQGLAQICADISNCLILLNRYSTFKMVSSDEGESKLMLELQKTPKIHLKWARCHNQLLTIDELTSTYIQQSKQFFHTVVLSDSSKSKEEINDIEKQFQSLSLKNSSKHNNNMDFIQETQHSEEQLKQKQKATIETLMEKFNHSPLDNLKNDLEEDEEISSTQDDDAFVLSVRIVNHRSIDPIIKYQSHFVHQLVLSTILSYSFSSGGIRKNNNLYLQHMSLIRNILLLESGTLIFLLENMIFGSITSGLGSKDNEGPGVLIGSLNLCSSVSKSVGSISSWPPSLSQIHMALSPCVDSTIEELVQSNVISAKDIQTKNYMNFGINELEYSSHYKQKDTRNENSQAYDITSTLIFKMIYNPPEPFNIFINERSVKIYNKIFGRLLQLLHVRYMVKQSLMVFKFESYRHSDQSITLILFKCSVFINILLSHFTQNIINDYWIRWIDFLQTQVFTESGERFDVEQTITLTELINAHTSLVSSIADAMFLQPRELDVTKRENGVKMIQKLRESEKNVADGLYTILQVILLICEAARPHNIQKAKLAYLQTTLAEGLSQIIENLDIVTLLSTSKSPGKQKQGISFDDYQNLSETLLSRLRELV